jgi:citrate lyase beta subunit
VPAPEGLDALVAFVDERLAEADAALVRDYPGAGSAWQPVHTVYVPADRFDAGTHRAYGDHALALLDEHEGTFREVTGADDLTLALVRDKLARQPVEDLRVDFEDGYGLRPDDEEDAAAEAASAALTTASTQSDAPGRWGIRFKSLEAPTRRRGMRTLTLVTELAHLDVVVLPKVTSVAQVETLVEVLDRLDRPDQRFEIQVETPQTILGPDGTALVARMIGAARGRCVGLHYGTYDYSAFLGIAAGDQSLEHPAADHAKAVMQAAAAGTGVQLSDGSTNRLPVGDQLREGWELHHRLVTRALHRGFYQGWDLHPAQLPTRYAATFQFFRAGAPEAVGRLAAWSLRQARVSTDRSQARCSTTDSDTRVADEPATARALADYLLRGLDCGALTEDEVGLDRAALQRLAKRDTVGSG